MDFYLEQSYKVNWNFRSLCMLKKEVIWPLGKDLGKRLYVRAQFLITIINIQSLLINMQQKSELKFCFWAIKNFDMTSS